MKDTFAISKNALVRLFGNGGNPNPDDPNEPHGPGGPVVRTIADRIAWVLLNPQPLPPKALVEARAAINQAIAEARVAEIAGRTEQGAQAMSAHVSDFVDDWCGTRVPGRPRPPHWVTVTPTAEEILTVGAQFQMAADGLGKGALQTTFGAAAERLFDTGIKRLEQTKAAAASGVLRKGVEKV